MFVLVITTKADGVLIGAGNNLRNKMKKCLYPNV